MQIHPISLRIVLQKIWFDEWAHKQASVLNQHQLVVARFIAHSFGTFRLLECAICMMIRDYKVLHVPLCKEGRHRLTWNNLHIKRSTFFSRPAQKKCNAVQLNSNCFILEISKQQLSASCKATLQQRGFGMAYPRIVYNFVGTTPTTSLSTSVKGPAATIWYTRPYAFSNRLSARNAKKK